MSGSRENAFQVGWSIENIKSWFETRDDTLYSPQFLAETLRNTRWKLRLSTNWHLEEKYISLTLQRDVEDDGPEQIPLNCELSFLARDGSPLKSKSCAMKFASKTVSLELNVKEAEVLEDKNEVYLPEGALMVCCKLCTPCSTVSKGGQCSIRSVIGTKSITLESTIGNFRELEIPTKVTVKFRSPSTEISLIAFDVYINEDVKFERIEVKSKCFRLYSCELYALNAGGKQICFGTVDELKNLLSSYKVCEFDTYTRDSIIYEKYLQDRTLKLQLDITYSPAIELECIKYEHNNFEKLSCGDKGIKDFDTINLENVNVSISNDLQLPQLMEKHDTEYDKSQNEDAYFDASRIEHGISSTLKQDLSSLYNDRLFCDTNLKTATETFPVHRCVLSARSPVFKKMFTTDMKEKAGESINVPDISPDTIRRMLQFLYTDCTGDLEIQSAKDLYVASDKYDIASLKEICSSFMKKKLCPSNVCEILVLADMHQDKDLESAAQEYVLLNDEEVFYSDEWKLFMKNYSCLAAQVMYLKCTKK